MIYEDYNEYDESDIKDLEQLYQLRHFCNLFSVQTVSQKLKVKIKRIELLTESGLHGSIFVDKLLHCKEEEIDDILEEMCEEVEDEQEAKYNATQKNQELIYILQEKRKTFATIGTNKAKRRLNKLAKNDRFIKAIRLALEIEDVNISAKNSYGKYKEKIYLKKEELICDLISLFKKTNWLYGSQESDIPLASKIIYFEIPGVEQLSWHSNNKDSLPNYQKPWDKKENATMDKLEIVVEKILKENNLL